MILISFGYPCFFRKIELFLYNFIRLYRMEGEKRYNDYPTFFKTLFKERVQKLSIDAGFSCPNRDGKKGIGGCTFCNNRSFNPDYDIYKEIPASRGIELKPNTSPMQRFMSTQNFALFTKGNSEYEVNKNTLYLTLLRATGIISNPKNSTRGTPAGPPLETPDLQQLGKNWAKFAIAFENKEQELFRLAEEYYSAYVLHNGICVDGQIFLYDGIGTAFRN